MSSNDGPTGTPSSSPTGSSEEAQVESCLRVLSGLDNEFSVFRPARDGAGEVRQEWEKQFWTDSLIQDRLGKLCEGMAMGAEGNRRSDSCPPSVSSGYERSRENEGDCARAPAHSGRASKPKPPGRKGVGARTSRDSKAPSESDHGERKCVGKKNDSKSWSNSSAPTKDDRGAHSYAFLRPDCGRSGSGAGGGQPPARPPWGHGDGSNPRPPPIEPKFEECDREEEEEEEEELPETDIPLAPFVIHDYVPFNWFWPAKYLFFIYVGVWIICHFGAMNFAVSFVVWRMVNGIYYLALTALVVGGMGRCYDWWSKILSRTVTWAHVFREEFEGHDERLLSHRTVEIKSKPQICVMRRTEWVREPFSWLRIPLEYVGYALPQLPTTQHRISASLFAEISVVWTGKYVDGMMDSAWNIAKRSASINVSRVDAAVVRLSTLAYFREWCAWQLEVNGVAPSPEHYFNSTIFGDGPAVKFC